VFWMSAAILILLWLLGLAISAATDVGDNAARETLEGIVRGEDGRVNKIGENVDQIDRVGVQSFLASQARE
jgi:bacterioferritin (cytochrome b1)